jgi:DNA-binding MarR family transcriptional regulator
MTKDRTIRRAGGSPGAHRRDERDPSAAPAVADDGPEDDYDEHSRWAIAEWSEIEAVVESIVSRIDMSQRHLERAAVDTRGQVGLAHGELKILLRLARGARSQGRLAKVLLVSTGTMTNQLDKLEGAGLIVRTPDPADRRGKIVEMTAKGRSVLDTYVNVQAKRERQLLSGLDEAEKEQLNGLLRKLMASFREQAGAVED